MTTRARGPLAPGEVVHRADRRVLDTLGLPAAVFAAVRGLPGRDRVKVLDLAHAAAAADHSGHPCAGARLLYRAAADPLTPAHDMAIAS